MLRVVTLRSSLYTLSLPIPVYGFNAVHLARYHAGAEDIVLHAIATSEVPRSTDTGSRLKKDLVVSRFELAVHLLLHHLPRLLDPP